MKNFLPFVFALLLLAACEKDPDLDKVQNQPLIYTQYDKTANFDKASTYYVNDSVLVIGNESIKDTTYLSANSAASIVNAFVANMNQRGYTRVEASTSADIGVQITYVENTYWIVDNNYNNGWWGNYPYYWSPSFWGGGWNGWWYPAYYSWAFSFTNGSLVCELLALNSNVATASSNKVPVIWTGICTNLLTGNSAVNLQNAVNGINQAFTQSTYIKK